MTYARARAFASVPIGRDADGAGQHRHVRAGVRFGKDPGLAACSPAEQRVSRNTRSQRGCGRLTSIAVGPRPTRAIKRPVYIAIPTTASMPHGIELCDFLVRRDAAGGGQRAGVVACADAAIAAMSVPCISPSRSTWV